MRHFKYLILIAIVALVTGCASQSGTEADADVGAADSGATTRGVDDGDMSGGSAVGDDRSMNLVDDRIVYFEFDKSDIQAQYRDLIRMHGRNLADNPDLSLRLEGHADERGTREYNIGLGERRAQSVKSALMVQGASAGQLTTVSYGEERPAAMGSNESAWAKNRRVELVYGN